MGNTRSQDARYEMLLIMLGGAAGCYLRYVVCQWCNLSVSRAMPTLGTMLVNVSGSFLLAVAAVLFLERLPSQYQDWHLLIGTGFCGGFTTFATFQWETFKLLRAGNWCHALANVFGSLLAGLLGILLGVALAGVLFPSGRTGGDLAAPGSGPGLQPLPSSGAISAGLAPGDRSSLRARRGPDYPGTEDPQ